MMKLTALAVRNIKRSLPKYAMYFFALSFSVFTVYSFLALNFNEQVMAKLTYSDRYRALLTSFGVIIFVFVTFFLISSNNSFIRARKKEISTYSLFGMTNRKIGLLLFIETMIIGSAALVAGLGLGMFTSKLTAMVLLNLTLAHFVGDVKFVIAPEAIYLTIIPFLLVFGVMGLSGRRVIGKFELIDLFKAHKTLETRFTGSIILLLLSLLLIGAGYYLAVSLGLGELLLWALPILALVITGTFLFFRSGLPKILSGLQNRPSYYRGDNLIAVSTFNHRIKSIGGLMAAIAVLSAVAVTVIASGYTLYATVEKSTYDTVGYDLYFYTDNEQVLHDVHAAFAEYDVNIIDEHTTYRYQAWPRTDMFVAVEWEFGTPDTYYRIYPQSEFNQLLSAARERYRQVEVGKGEAVLAVRTGNNELLEKEWVGRKLHFSDSNLTVTACLDLDITVFGAYYTVVVSDSDFAALMENGDIVTTDTGGRPFDRVTVVKYENPLGSHDLNRKLNQVLRGRVGSYRMAYNHYIEALEAFGLVCFIGFFMSIVFILMTASLLYFKQVMAAQEERHLYQMLRKIGISGRMEGKVIAKRLFPVFFIPLLVGFAHSIFAMKSADTMVFSSMLAVENSYLTVLQFSAVMYGVYALIYGVFYFITKRQYSNIVS